MPAGRGDVPGAGAGPGADRVLRSQPTAPAPIPLALRHVVIGVLAEAEEQVQQRAAGPITALGRTLRPAGGRIARLPLVDVAGRRAAEVLSRMAERGRREEENYRRRADDVVRHAASAAVRSAALDDVVDEVATRLAGPVVDAQLPLVLARLSERPESLRRIVDETADRFANRFLQRPTDISQ